MKRLLYIFIFLICCSSAVAQNRIKLETTIGVKVFTLNNFKIKNETNSLICKIGYLNLNFQESLLWKNFKLSIKADNYFNAINPVSYSPKQVIYFVIAEYNYKNFNISYNHTCYHPIICDSDRYGGLFGGYEYFGISYKF